MYIDENVLLVLDEQIMKARIRIVIIETFENQNELYSDVIKQHPIILNFYYDAWDQLLLTLIRIQDHTGQSIGLISLLEKIKDEKTKIEIKSHKIYQAVKHFRDKLGIVHLDSTIYCNVELRNSCYDEFKISLREISSYLDLCSNVVQQLLTKIKSNCWIGTCYSYLNYKKDVIGLFQSLSQKAR